ncbi:jacalin-related lectin 19-like [Sesamum indicum]|uniref:Jacalin-related lectin 19-like n=1 Tax=Sesamum indicum TaxID=4182 RepID=A0A8M8UUA8_SESIN|nr:jacalin-related lectin 19-like [Sesamum indicum]
MDIIKLKLYHFSIRCLANHEREKNQTSEKKKAIFLGPWGGPGGRYWDDGNYSRVREIILIYVLCIDSIRVLYDKNGMPVLSEKHGGPGGHTNAEVKLQFPDEYLTEVSGHCSPLGRRGNAMVRSLKFRSNWRTYGPFGVESETPFCFPMEGGMIVGFRGRCGLYVDAIGFHITQA